MEKILGMTAMSFIFKIFTEPIVLLQTVLLYWWLRFKGRHRRLDLYVATEKIDLTKNDVIIPPLEVQLDMPQTEMDQNVADTVFVYGGNCASKSRLVGKITRRKGYHEACLYLQLDDGRSYHLPSPERIYPPSQGFSAGGLHIKSHTAMRRFRVSFNGLLREQCPGEKEARLVHVKFSFVGSTSSYPFDHSTDIQPTVMAEYFRKQNSSVFMPDPTTVTKYLDTYIQSASFYGTISVDGGDEFETVLLGARKRYREIFEDSQRAHLSEFIGYSKDGQLIHSGEYVLPGLKSKLPFGFHLERNTLSWPTKKCEQTLTTKQVAFNGLKIKIVTERSKVSASVSAPTCTFTSKGSNTDSTIYFSKFSFDDGDTGHGIFIENTWGTRNVQNMQKPCWTISNTVASSRSFVLPLDSESCQDSSLSGGKGASLATLTGLARKNKTEFIVPSGFVVTTEAYGEFYRSAAVAHVVGQLEKEAWSYGPDKTKEKCENLVSRVSESKLPSSLQQVIERQLQSLFPQETEKRRFAVRSSASGEDSEEMSAAGQMSTLLGVEGLQNIFQAVVKCWASQFSFTAIQYKRQNGQPLNSPMAVVVQEMVPADTAGVLFTCDPVTGNPQNVTITANYGLGESVVSASADPDTLVFERKENQGVELKYHILGKKTKKIIMGDKGNVEEHDVNQSEADSCCLSEEKGLLLSRTSLKIEEAYGFPVDIEWAFKENQLYMLQARPITTLDLETKFELTHAYSSSIRSEDEYNTKANVGEVMPNATSHFGISFVDCFFVHCVQVLYCARNKYSFPFNPFYRFMTYFQNHVFINMPNFFLRFYAKGEQSFLAESNQISGFGRLLDDPEIFEQADRRNRTYPLTFMPLQICYFLYDMVFGDRILTKCVEKFWHKEPNFAGCRNSLEMYERFWRSALHYVEGANGHLISSLNSSIYNTLVMGILASENKGWDPNVYSDLGMILSSCGNLESADIPRSMMNLATEIKKCIDVEKFQKMSPEEALKWLESTTSSAGRSYRDLIEKHGHRCLNEFDVYTKPWRVNRLPMVKAVQDAVNQSNQGHKAMVPVNEVIEKLKVPLSWKSKLLLKILIPLCRRGVFNRERSKGLLIKIIDHNRKGSWTLSEQLVKEGRLPDKDLMFFLSYYEVYDLIRTRSPALVQKAIRRRQIFSELDKLKFPEITKGFPRALNLQRADNNEQFESDLEIRGTPVSQGVIRAKARVATSIEEAAFIQAGEILIAYSTDIAWSPYFPMLSGVATELGGLISHGAVVAREYGLPCVVGVRDATLKFKTGDYILLDGNKGILKRIDT